MGDLFMLWFQAVEVGVSGGGADEEDVVDGEELMAVALELMGQMDIEISDQEGVASVVDMAGGGGGGGSGTARGDSGIPVVAVPTVSDKQENMDEVSGWSGVGSSLGLCPDHTSL